MDTKDIHLAINAGEKIIERLNDLAWRIDIGDIKKNVTQRNIDCRVNDREAMECMNDIILEIQENQIDVLKFWLSGLENHIGEDE